MLRADNQEKLLQSRNPDNQTAQGFKLSTESLQLLVKMEDSVCALVALHARSLGLAETPAELDSLAAALTGGELYDSRWMLAYEAAVRGWLVPADGKDFIVADVNFSKLKTAGVSFYDVTKTTLPPLPAPKLKIPTIAEMFERKLSEDDEEEPEEETETYYWCHLSLISSIFPVVERMAEWLFELSPMSKSRMSKSTVDQIRERFDGDVERFSNLETGQSATIDAPLSLALIAEAASRVNPHATSLLDVGCGAGNYTLKVLERLPNLDVTLIDLSRPMLDRAVERVSRATSGRVTALQGDVRELQIGDPRCRTRD